jgi:hypothetical protein
MYDGDYLHVYWPMGEGELVITYSLSGDFIREYYLVEGD